MSEDKIPLTPMPEYNAEPIKVLIVDDDKGRLQSLKAMLEPRPDVRVVGIAEDASTAKDKALEINPDIILIECELPGVGGIGLTEQLARLLPEVAIIVLSDREDNTMDKASHLAGARDFVVKPIDSQQLVANIRRVFLMNPGRSRSDKYLSPELPSFSLGEKKLESDSEPLTFNLAKEQIDDLGVVFSKEQESDEEQGEEKVEIPSETDRPFEITAEKEAPKIFMDKFSNEEPEEEETIKTEEDFRRELRDIPLAEQDRLGVGGELTAHLVKESEELAVKESTDKKVDSEILPDIDFALPPDEKTEVFELVDEELLPEKISEPVDFWTQTKDESKVDSEDLQEVSEAIIAFPALSLEPILEKEPELVSKPEPTMENAAKTLEEGLVQLKAEVEIKTAEEKEEEPPKQKKRGLFGFLFGRFKKDSQDGLEEVDTKKKKANEGKRLTEPDAPIESSSSRSGWDSPEWKSKDVLPAMPTIIAAPGWSAEEGAKETFNKSEEEVLDIKRDFWGDIIEEATPEKEPSETVVDSLEDKEKLETFDPSHEPSPGSFQETVGTYEYELPYADLGTDEREFVDELTSNLMSSDILDDEEKAAKDEKTLSEEWLSSTPAESTFMPNEDIEDENEPQDLETAKPEKVSPQNFEGLTSFQARDIDSSEEKTEEIPEKAEEPKNYWFDPLEIESHLPIETLDVQETEETIKSDMEDRYPIEEADATKLETTLLDLQKLEGASEDWNWALPPTETEDVIEPLSTLNLTKPEEIDTENSVLTAEIEVPNQELERVESLEPKETDDWILPPITEDSISEPEAELPELFKADTGPELVHEFLPPLIEDVKTETEEEEPHQMDVGGLPEALDLLDETVLPEPLDIPITDETPLPEVWLETIEAPTIEEATFPGEQSEPLDLPDETVLPESLDIPITDETPLPEIRLETLEEPTIEEITFSGEKTEPPDLSEPGIVAEEEIAGNKEQLLPEEKEETVNLQTGIEKIETGPTSFTLILKEPVIVEKDENGSSTELSVIEPEKAEEEEPKALPVEIEDFSPWKEQALDLPDDIDIFDQEPDLLEPEIPVDVNEVAWPETVVTPEELTIARPLLPDFETKLPEVSSVPYKPSVAPPGTGQAGKLGRLIMVYSGKGGVGRSVIAANLACALSLDLGAKVAIIDLDLQFGDISSLMGQPHERGTIVDLKRDDMDLDFLRAVLWTGSNNVSVLSAPAKPELADDIGHVQVARILKMMRSEFDYIVIDGGRYFGDSVIDAMEQAAKIILVTNSNYLAIKDTQHVLIMTRMLQIEPERLLVVLNRTEKDSNFKQEEIEKNLGRKIATVIPHEPKIVGDSIDAGRPFVIGQPKSKATAAIKELMVAVLDRPGSSKGSFKKNTKEGGLFKRGSKH